MSTIWGSTVSTIWDSTLCPPYETVPSVHHMRQYPVCSIWGHTDCPAYEAEPRVQYMRQPPISSASCPVSSIWGSPPCPAYEAPPRVWQALLCGFYKLCLLSIYVFLAWFVTALAFHKISTLFHPLPSFPVNPSNQHHPALPPAQPTLFAQLSPCLFKYLHFCQMNPWYVIQHELLSLS